jgi:MYXO-CTERM domain-containing protein
MLTMASVHTNYYQFTDDMFAPTIEFTGDNTHLVADADYVYDNEEFTVSFMIHDYPNAYSGLSDLWLEYDDGTTAANATIVQTGLSSFEASFGPFAFDTDVSYYVYVEDSTGWYTYSDTLSFSVEYSDTLAPEIDISLSADTIYTNESVTVTVEVEDVSEDEEVVSGIDTVVIEYSTDGGSTWTEATATQDGSTYTATLSGLSAGTVQVRATATDNAGNSDTSDAVSFTVNDVPTTTTTTTAAPGPGFEALFGLMALLGLTVVIARRRKR